MSVDDGVVRVAAEDYLDVTTRVLTGLGCPPEPARVQGEQLLAGDLRGHPSHGLRRLETLAQRIRAGVLDPAAEARLEWTTPAVLTVDGRRGLGPPAAHAAVDGLIERMGETGVAAGAVRNANHLGMLAPYVERIADRGGVGLALTTSEALVHPWGGSEAMVGTNPVALAVPTGGEPLVLDMATGQISMGKVLDHAARGVALPEGAAVDSDGNPTTDAAAAAEGAISPFGGPKGYGLAVAVELMVAALTGTALGRDVTGTLDATSVCTKGDLLVVFDVERFGGFDPTALQGYVDDLRATPPAPGSSGVSVPGDRVRRVTEENRRAGVPLADATWQRARHLLEHAAT